MQNRLREIYRRFSPFGEKLPDHVKRHPEHGLVYVKEDKYSLTRNEITIPGTADHLRFDSRARYQGEYLLELNSRFPGLFPQMLGWTDKNQTGMIMEYIPGQSLYRYAETGQSVPEQILSDIYKARDLLHANGYAHGDLKEDNIILTTDSAGTINGFKFIDPVPPVLKPGEPGHTKSELLAMLRHTDGVKMSEWISLQPYTPAQDN